MSAFYFRKRGFIFMKYINELREGNPLSVFFSFQKKKFALYEKETEEKRDLYRTAPVRSMQKSGIRNSMGIDGSEALDYVDISGDITVAPTARFRFDQACKKRGRRGRVQPGRPLPTSRGRHRRMYQEPLSWIETVKTSIFPQS